MYEPSLKLPEFGLTMLCPLLALSGHHLVRCTCPLSGAKQTSVFSVAVDRRAGRRISASEQVVPRKDQKKDDRQHDAEQNNQQVLGP